MPPQALLLVCSVGYLQQHGRPNAPRVRVRLSGAADFSSLRAGELKLRLRERGVDTADVFEKDELVRLLVAAEARAPAPAARAPAGLPLLRYGTKQGYGGLQTAADKKLYRGFAVQLPDLGMQIPFVLDSASSSSLISPALAARLKRGSTGATVTGSSATGSLTGLRQVSLGRASIGGVPCGALDAVVMELPLADDERVGLLGLDMLRRLDVDLRFADGAALAYPVGGFARAGAPDHGGRPLRPVRCAQSARGLLTCEVRLGTPWRADVRLTAIVDSGSPTTIANWAAANAAGISRADARLSPTAAMMGASGEPVRIAEAGATVQLGGSGAERRVTLSIADLPIFAALGQAAEPALIVGLDVVGADRLVLSVGTGAMWVAE